MAFIFPTNRKQVADRARTDVQNNLAESNPFLANSFLDSLIVGFAGRVFDFYLQLRILTTEMFPDTATGTFLERWGSYKGITRNPATKAEGSIIVLGTAGTVLPLDTTFSNSNGLLFDTQSTVTVVTNSLAVSTMNRVGGTVTVETSDSTPSLASGMEITISGAVEVEYNGTHTITMTALNTFTFEISGTPTTPATGSAVVSYDGIAVSVESQGFGQDQNLSQGNLINITSPTIGIDNGAYVQFGAIAGGTDLESDDDLRARIIDRYQNPISLFNVAAIDAKAREVSGVTRVFVLTPDDSLGVLDIASIERLESGGAQDLAVVTTNVNHNMITGNAVTIGEATIGNYNVVESKVIVLDDLRFAYRVTGDPVTPAVPAGANFTGIATTPAGQVRIYFMRDNDLNPIPDASEVAQTKAKIIEIKPAATAEVDVVVLSPTPISVDITFSSITPNNATIQSSVNANLEAYFKDETAVGKTLTLKQIESVILQTVDTESGLSASDFTLSAPAGDTAIGVGEIPVLGNITYL